MIVNAAQYGKVKRKVKGFKHYYSALCDVHVYMYIGRVEYCQKHIFFLVHVLYMYTLSDPSMESENGRPKLKHLYT